MTPTDTLCIIWVLHLQTVNFWWKGSWIVSKYVRIVLKRGNLPPSLRTQFKSDSHWSNYSSIGYTSMGVSCFATYTSISTTAGTLLTAVMNKGVDRFKIFDIKSNKKGKYQRSALTQKMQAHFIAPCSSISYGSVSCGTHGFLLTAV